MGLIATIWDDARRGTECSPAVALWRLLLDPGLQLLVSHRVAQAAWRNRLFRWLVPFLRYRQYRQFSCMLAPSAQIGRRVSFPHPLGIVVGRNAVHPR